MTRRSPGDGGLWQQKTGKRLWVGSVEIPALDGKRRQRRVYGKTKSGCADKLRKLRADVFAGNVPVTGRTTVTQWCQVWLTTVCKPHVRPKTYAFYEEAIRLHVVPQIGAVRLDRLTAQHVRTMLAKISTTRNRQRAHLTLKMALDTATNEGMIPRNVVKLVDTPEHRPASRTALDLDIARRVITAAIELDQRSGHPKLAARWIAGLILGSRKGELIGLEWNRVNTTDRRVGMLPPESVDISWQLQQLDKSHGCERVHGCGIEKPCGKTQPGECPQAKWSCGRQSRAGFCPQAKFAFEPGFIYRPCYRSLCWTPTKTKAGKRVVPLDYPLLQMLQHHQAHDDVPNPHDLVWHHVDGRPISPREDHDLWAELVEYAGIDYVSTHTLRHTAATLLQQDRVPDEVRMQIMGQSSYAAHQAYIHVDTTQERAALRALGQRLVVNDES